MYFFDLNKILIQLDEPKYNPKVETKEEYRNKYNDSIKLGYGKIEELELKLKKDLEPYTAPAPFVNYLIEIDISKAFTAAFQQITEIPIFNEFDSFTIYNNETIALNNLYIVKVKIGHFFINKLITCAMVSLFVSLRIMLRLSPIKAHHL